MRKDWQFVSILRPTLGRRWNDDVVMLSAGGRCVVKKKYDVCLSSCIANRTRGRRSFLLPGRKDPLTGSTSVLPFLSPAPLIIPKESISVPSSRKSKAHYFLLFHPSVFPSFSPSDCQAIHRIATRKPINSKISRLDAGDRERTVLLRDGIN